MNNDQNGQNISMAPRTNGCCFADEIFKLFRLNIIQAIGSWELNWQWKISLGMDVFMSQLWGFNA